jgi:hypothetical protein
MAARHPADPAVCMHFDPVPANIPRPEQLKNFNAEA